MINQNCDINLFYIQTSVHNLFLFMEFPICEKHKKSQKTGSKANTNGYICMNRYCPDSFKVFCSQCKNDHRDHAVKILTLEDTTFLIQRLIKHPFKEPNRYIGQALDIMKKLKLIKEFRKKIDILEKQIQKEALKLIDHTESLLSQYKICQQGVQNLAELLTNIETSSSYHHFFQNSQQLLSNLDYNFKKDKMEFGNALTKEKEDKRRKTHQNGKRKIEQVRDYSMKIIEVILHNNESDDQEEDFSYQKKHYQMLRNQLCQEKGESQLEEEISELKGSKLTINKSRVKNNLFDVQSQTTQSNIVEELTTYYENKIKDLLENHNNNEKSLQTQLTEVSSQKQNLNRELNSWKKKYQDKRKNIKDLEVSLRDNRIKRVNKQKAREQVVTKIIDLWQIKGSNNEDKND